MKCAFVLGGAKQDVPGGIRYMATEATDQINQITLQMHIQHNTKTDIISLRHSSSLTEANLTVQANSYHDQMSIKC